MLRGRGAKPSPNTKLQWSAEGMEAFEKTKEALINATQLTHPHPTAEISITTMQA